MIILTLNPRTDPAIRTFNKDAILIGADGEFSEADLLLAEEGLMPAHLKIQKIGAKYTLFNIANDPFLTLNGQPFGKKSLKKGDSIGIGNTEIVFDYKEAHEIPPVELPKTSTPKKDTAPSSLKPDGIDIDELVRQTEQLITPENTISTYSKLDWLENEGIAAAKEEQQSPLEQVETLLGLDNKQEEPLALTLDSHEIVFKFEEAVKETSTGNQAQTETNIDEPIQAVRPLPVDNETQEKHHIESSSLGLPSVTSQLPSGIWKRYALGLLAIMMGVGLIGGYVVITEQSNQEEIRAAQGLSDTAMAIAYAQLNHTKPHNQNWLDPEFIKENLNSILSTNYTPLADVDIQGQLRSSPYILRLYTSHDSSQFLLIAQPVPSWHHWLLPKPALIVDSHQMEIRKTTDLRTLNRLLADPNTADSSNTPEIINLVHQGEALPLTYLANQSEHPEFATPKELAYVRPGAENVIYNAPRYYLLSKPMIDKIEQLNSDPNNSQKITPLLQDIAKFSKLSNMVLYSSKGLVEAMLVQKGLMPFAPSQGFLVGYLSFDPESRQVNGSHLILVANYFSKKPHSNTNSASLESAGKAIEIASEDLTKAGIDIHNPLFMRLSAISTERKKKLKGVSEELITLLSLNTQHSIPKFNEHFDNLIAEYRHTNNEVHMASEAALLQLYQENMADDFKLTPALYLAYVEASGLGVFAQNNSKIQSAMEMHGMTPEQIFERQIHAILQTKDLISLDQAVEEAATALDQSKQLSDENYRSFQDQLRISVMQKLEQFMLFPSNKLPPDTFNDKNRWILLRILKNGQVTDPDERDFYLSQFDALSKGNAKR